MANTITTGQGIISITNIDSDWSWLTTLPQHVAGIRVEEMTFTMLHENDYLVLRDGSASGATIAYFKNLTGTTGTGQTFTPRGIKLRPFLDVSASSPDLNSELLIRYRL